MHSYRSYLMLFVFLAFFATNSLATSTDQNPNDAFIAMANAGAEYLNDSSQSPGVISAAALQDYLELITVIDIRSEDSFLSGHIPGAYHSSLASLLHDLDTWIPSSKPYVIACYTGQASGHAKIAMELLGYDVKSLRYGMSAWNSSLDLWTANCADNLDYAETENQNANLILHSYPDLSEDPETVVEERVSVMLASGFKGISYLNLVDNLDQFFIINYFGEADYLGQGTSGVPGHIPGAFQFSPYNSLGLDQMLDNIPVDQPVVVYDWSGHASSQVVAYLNMLGYDAYSLKFGANNLFYSQLTAHFWGPYSMHDFPLEYGPNTSAVPHSDQSVVTRLENYPNPFNPVTTISYQLSESARINLRVYDLAGRLVRDLANGLQQSAGVHQFNWQGYNDAGQSVPSGTYIYRLEAGNQSESRLLMLLK